MFNQNYTPPSQFVTVAYGEGATPLLVSCGPQDGGQGVVFYQPGAYVMAGTIVIIRPAQLPDIPGTIWSKIPALGYWVAMVDGVLPASPPTWGNSTDALHFSQGSSIPPSG